MSLTPPGQVAAAIRFCASALEALRQGIVAQPAAASASQCDLKSTAQATSVLQPGTERASAECGEGIVGPPDGASASQCGARVLDEAKTRERRRRGAARGVGLILKSDMKTPPLP